MRKISLFFLLLFVCCRVSAQFCGTPGLDGPGFVSGTFYNDYAINTYFPIQGEVVKPAGSTDIMLGKLLNYDGQYGKTPVSPGDLLLVIQMQDAIIDYNNDNRYGSGNPSGASDGKGGTGYIDLANSGKYEYILATNAVPLSGGRLTFRGAGPGKGLINSYVNAAATAVRGTRSFQVIRVPQYSSFKLTNRIMVPIFTNGVGGIIAVNIAGILNFNNQTIDANAKGFRGGYSNAVQSPYSDYSSLYAVPFTDTRVAAKGEGIAGTPRWTTGGDSGSEGLPGGTNGRGAPGNAGGGGKDFNTQIGGMDKGSGGGGGGNGGSGGTGADYPIRTFLMGGRPGSAVYAAGTLDIDRLIMGGGGGAGGSHYIGANNSGGAGGAIVLLNAGQLLGTGAIQALAQPGSGGGGGAGGTVFINSVNTDPFANITIIANGAKDGGMGGAGGGGQVFHNLSIHHLNAEVKGGINDSKSGMDGQDGHVVIFSESDLPLYLRTGCYPELLTSVSESASGAVKFPGSTATYQVKLSNGAFSGGATGVQADVQLPSGFNFESATAIYSGNATGSGVLNNTGTANRPMLGTFYIPAGDAVTITLNVKIACSVAAGTYHTSAQAIYLDPTRLSALRKIKPALHAFADSGTLYPTEYESSTSVEVPGSNYNGGQASSGTDDVNIVLPAAAPNTINIPSVPLIFCESGDPALIHGGEVMAESFSYQWQQSADGLNYTDIPGATSRDYDPPLITASTHYRRQVNESGCVPRSSFSEALQVKVVAAVQVDFEVPDACAGDGASTFINKTVVHGGAGSSVNYLWDFGDVLSDAGNPNSSGERDGMHVYSKADNYTVALKVTVDGVCVQRSVSKPFRVNGRAVAGFSTEATACSGKAVVFKDLSSIDFGEVTRIDWYYDYTNHPGLVETDNSPAKRSDPAKEYRHTYPEFYSPATRTVQVRMVVYSGTSCVDEQIIPLTLKAVPQLEFAELAPVCLNTPAFTLTQAKEAAGVLGGTGSYSGSGVNASGEFDPAVAGTGPHQLNYTFTPDNGCPVTINSTILVLELPVANAGPDLTIAEGCSIQLSSASASGTGLSYKWTPASGLDRDDVLNPVASPQTDMTYRLTVRAGGQCISWDEMTVKVQSKSSIPNTIHVEGETVVCSSGDPGILRGTAAAAMEVSATYSWQQSADNLTYTDIPGASGRDYDPGPLDRTTWFRRILHYGSCTLGAGSPVQIRVIRPFAINFEAEDICVNDGAVTFKAIAAYQDGSTGTFSYHWDFDDPDHSGAGNPNSSTDQEASHLYTSSGVYTVTLKVSVDGYCEKSTTRTFTVNGLLKADFEIRTDSPCSGGEVEFEDRAVTDYGELSRIDWYYDNIRLPAAVQTDISPAKRGTPKFYRARYPLFHSPATMEVEVRMVVYSGKGCVNEKKKTITLKALPQVEFAELSPVCMDVLPFQLNQGSVQNGLPGTGMYSGPGVSPGGKFDPKSAGSGVRTLRYTFTADHGCEATATRDILVLPLPQISAGPDLEVLAGQSIRLASSAPADLKYEWSPAVFLDRTDVLQPLASPPKDMTYRLTVTYAGGCTAYDELRIRVVPEPEIPNVFSPNGDGTNDVWKLRYLESYPKAVVSIYNRYGEKLYSTEVATMKGWDGKFKGLDVPAGTYYYVIDLQNGSKALSGPLTVLR